MSRLHIRLHADFMPPQSPRNAVLPYAIWWYVRTQQGFCMTALQSCIFSYSHLVGYRVWTRKKTRKIRDKQAGGWGGECASEDKISVFNSATDFHLSTGKTSPFLCRKRMTHTVSQESCSRAVLCHFISEWRVFLQPGLCREIGKSLLWLMGLLRFFKQLRQQCWHEKQEQRKPLLSASSSRFRQRGCYCWELLPSAVTQNRGEILIWQNQVYIYIYKKNTPW